LSDKHAPRGGNKRTATNPKKQGTSTNTTVAVKFIKQSESNFKDFSSGWSTGDFNEDGASQVRRLADPMVQAIWDSSHSEGFHLSTIDVERHFQAGAFSYNPASTLSKSKTLSCFRHNRIP